MNAANMFDQQVAMCIADALAACCDRVSKTTYQYIAESIGQELLGSYQSFDYDGFIALCIYKYEVAMGD